VSEAIAGIPVPPLAEVRLAAVVVLVRHVGHGFEVFWVRRSAQVGFAPGFFAFTGGRVDAGDGLLAGVSTALEGCAARELFEEAGVSLTQSGQSPLDRTKVSFAQWLERSSQRVDRTRLLPAGRWVTPPYLQQRFDTHFFLVELKAGESASVDGREATWGEWVRPDEALARWQKGEALLHPPQVHVLNGLLLPGLLSERATQLAGSVDGGAKIQFQSGVWLLPLPTATLPPATHTNCYILGTGARRLLVDPGTDDEEVLDGVCMSLANEGVTLEAIVATHHHADHVGGLQALAERLRCRVWAHRDTATRLAVPAHRVLAEGDVLTLEGPRPMAWRVLHTPGHARGHVTLVDEASRAAICGDMVAGVGTIVIDPPEGDMGEYVKQLARLKQFVGALYPAHGPVIADGVAKLDEYLAHRAWREGKVVSALMASPQPVDDIVASAYDDVASFIWPLAERNTVAILDKLEREGRARSEAAGWCAGF
jgi:endoribonuclease LACTB2